MRKRDRSARSLEVVTEIQNTNLKTNAIKEAEEKWLIKKIEYFFEQAEAAGSLSQPQLDQLYVLIGALKVLGLDGAAQSFMPRLSQLKQRVQ